MELYLHKHYQMQGLNVLQMWKEPVYVPNWRRLYLFYPPYESLGSTFLRLHFWDDQHSTRPLLPSCCLRQPQKYLCPRTWEERPWGKFDSLASPPLPPPGITGLPSGSWAARGDFQRWESSESDKSPQIQEGALKSHVTNWHKGGKKSMQI